MNEMNAKEIFQENLLDVFLQRRAQLRNRLVALRVSVAQTTCTLCNRSAMPAMIFCMSLLSRVALM
jgi:hypothetical protein